MKTLVGPRTEGAALIGIVAALIVVTVGRVLDLVPPLYGLPIVKALTVLAVLAFLLSPQIPRPSFAESQLARLVLALVVLAVASLAFSAWRAVTWLAITGTVAAITALSVLIYKTSGTLATAEKYLRALAIAAGALTLGGLLFRGEGRLAFGRLYDPNDLAFVLIATLPIVLAFWRLARGGMRWAWLATAVASVAVILLTQSRGGLVGLLMVVSYLAAVGAWKARLQTGFRFGRVAVGWLLLVALAVPAWTLLPADARERYATLLDPQSDYNVTATREGRVAVWSRGVDALIERPWGIGIGAYPMAEMARSGYWRTAHNSILQVAVELGIVGGVLYLLMLWRSWRVLGVVMRSGPAGPAVADRTRGPPRRGRIVAVDERWAIHAQHLRAALIGIVVTGFFLSQGYALVVFAIVGVVAALEARYAPRSQRVRAPAAREADAPVVAKPPRAADDGPVPRPYWR